MEKRTPMAIPMPMEAALRSSSTNPRSAVGMALTVGAGVVVGAGLGIRLGAAVGSGLGNPVDTPVPDTVTEIDSR